MFYSQTKSIVLHGMDKGRRGAEAVSPRPWVLSFLWEMRLVFLLGLYGRGVGCQGGSDGLSPFPCNLYSPTANSSCATMIHEGGQQSKNVVFQRSCNIPGLVRKILPSQQLWGAGWKSVKASGVIHII